MNRIKLLNMLAGMLLAAVATGGALYITALKIEIRRLELLCPVGEVDSPPELSPPRRALGPAEA